MKNSTKKTLAIVGLIVVLVLLWFFLKSKPGLVRQLENAIAPAVAGVFATPELSGYTPHDFPLPNIPNGAFVNFGCNFCSKTSVTPVPPTMPVSAPATPNNSIAISQPAFGGGGMTPTFFGPTFTGFTATGTWG